MTPKQPLPLQDIHLPEAINWWPPALGWWLLILVVFVALLGVIIVIKRYRKKWGYRREALKLLQQSYNASKTQKNESHHHVHSMISTLKRTALTAYPTHNIYHLHGKAWLDFLNQHTSKPYFNDTLHPLFCAQQYQVNPDQTPTDIHALYHACVLWVKKHVVIANTQSISGGPSHV